MIAGSRESKLAMAQAEEFKERLEKATDEKCQITGITSTGDKDQTTHLAQMGGDGVFVKELDEALYEGKIDCSVNSLKDVPTKLDPRLTVAAVLPRADVRDAMIPTDLRTIACGAIVGTSSVRREMLLRATKPTLRVKPIRGNMQTRMEKLRRKEYSALIMAKAGLDRLGITEDVHPIDKIVFVPAAAQGAIGVVCRSDDRKTIDILKKVDDAKTRTEVTFERDVLRRMDAGCSSPIGVNAELKGDTLEVIAVSFLDIVPVRIHTTFPASEAKEKAIEIGDKLLKKA